jgi:hypothetical protein
MSASASASGSASVSPAPGGGSGAAGFLRRGRVFSIIGGGLLLLVVGVGMVFWRGAAGFRWAESIE